MRLVQLAARVVRTLLSVMRMEATMTGRTSTRMVTSRRTSLTSTVQRALFRSKLAVRRGRMDLVGRGGLVAEGVAVAVVGRARVPVRVRLRAAAIGKFQ